MSNLSASPRIGGLSQVADVRRIPRLFEENNDLSPRISNAPSVRKYEAQQALSPLLNLALLAAPGNLLTQALTYSPDSEAADFKKMLQMFYHGSNQPLRRGVVEGVLDITPQRRVAEYYAGKRASQLGGTPEVTAILADPFAGKKHGLSIPIDNTNPVFNATQARKISEADRPFFVSGEDGVAPFANGGLI